MSKRTKLAMGIIPSFILLLYVYQAFTDVPFEVAADEVALEIQLDIGEDIGLFVVDHEVGDTRGSGGVSNADKSLLKHDDRILYTFDQRDLDARTDLSGMTIQFTIITEYVDPNYENVYPPEYTQTLEPFVLDAKWGESYLITIQGDKINGYTATWG